MDPLPKNVSELPPPPNSEGPTKKIIMFGRKSCPDCLKVKKFFSQNSIEYEYHDIDLEKDALNWVSAFSKTIPVVILTDGTLLYSPDDRVLMERLLPAASGAGLKASEPQVFDTIIIGAGPAGISAAIYAVRKSLKVLILTKDIGGQAVRSGDIENLVGFTMITGGELAQKFRDELKKFGDMGLLWVKEGVEVKEVTGTEGNFTVRTQSNAYLGRTVIIASGRNPKMLNVPGEKQLFGKGVATCATCDGPLYKGQMVAVVGGGNSALDAAFSLAKVAKEVTLINLSENLKGDSVLLENVSKLPNVHVLNSYQVVEIVGSTQVEGVTIENMQTHEKLELKVSGVFIEIGWTPSVDFAPQIAKDKQNQIIVDEFGQTSVPGIWACGDVNNLWGEQIVIAAGEGAKVALVVAEHIAGIPHRQTSNTHED